MHLTQKMLSFATLSNEIFCGSFLVENHVFCACNSSEMNFIPQPLEQERYRRQTQCSSTLWEYLCTWPSWCCPLQPFQMRIFVVHFDWKSWYFVPGWNNSKTKFIPQPQKQKNCRRQPQCSNTLFEGLCTWLNKCCPLQPFQMRYCVVHFNQNSWYLCAFHNSKTYFIPKPQI